MARHSKGGHHNHYNDVGFTRGTGMSTGKTIAALREIGEHVLNAAKEELKKGAETVVADAKALCPVKTGRLRNSIRAESNKDGSVYQIVADASVASPKSETGRFYCGAVVEFRPGGKPFMYPAMEQNRQKIYDNVSAAISRAIRGG